MYRLLLVEKRVSTFGHPVFDWKIISHANDTTVLQFREVSHDLWQRTPTVRCGCDVAGFVHVPSLLPPSSRSRACLLPRRLWRAERERNARDESDRMMISTSFKTIPPRRGECGPSRAQTKRKKLRRQDGLMVGLMGREGMIPSSRLTRRTPLQPMCLRQQSQITPRRPRWPGLPSAPLNRRRQSLVQ